MLLCTKTHITLGASCFRCASDVSSQPGTTFVQTKVVTDDKVKVDRRAMSNHMRKMNPPLRCPYHSMQ